MTTAYRMNCSLFETGLLQDTVESSDRNIVARLAGNRVETLLRKLV
jgi:hypothetical protein